MLLCRFTTSFAVAMNTDSTQLVSNHVLSKRIWVLPSIITALLTVLSYFTSLVLPVPFLIMLICVIVAGVYGGFASGVLAGLVSVILIFCSHFFGFGPPQLTEGVAPATVGSIIYLLVGANLGHLKDQRDASFATIRENERNLEAALQFEKDKAEEQISKLEQTAARLAMAVRIAGIGHFRWNVKTGYCEFCSKQHAAHFGLTAEEFQTLTAGKDPYTGFVHEEDRERFLESINRIDQGEAMFFEYRVHRPNGDIRFLRQICEAVFKDGEPVAIVGACIDLTDLREAEARVRQSQRIEAVGTLTGGVAHDFNNLLAIILGNLELILKSEDPEDRRHLTNEAITATQRGASLTKNLLSFSRRAHLNPTRLNLNQLVENTMKWSSRILPANISIENSTLGDLWDTDLDSTSVENAIINILLNARDAMPTGGKVTIETTNIIVGKELTEDLHPGRYVMLKISDTGQGIEPDQLDRIFEPFHSNKPVGMGSGLGLSMVQSFIEQSAGAIHVSSEPGIGTTFKLYFKAAENTVRNPGSEVDSEQILDQSSVKILLVEDEEKVIQLLKRILEDAGHHITTAPNGDSALEIFNTRTDFDVLVTDVVMPGLLQGPALAKAVRAIQPDIACVFISGYASEAIIDSNGLEPSDVQLMKPVKRSDLLAAVSTVTSSRQLIREGVE